MCKKRCLDIMIYGYNVHDDEHEIEPAVGPKIHVKQCSLFYQIVMQ